MNFIYYSISRDLVAFPFIIVVACSNSPLDFLNVFVTILIMKTIYLYSGITPVFRTQFERFRKKTKYHMWVIVPLIPNDSYCPKTSKRKNILLGAIT
jgi:hypothetical protein